MYRLASLTVLILIHTFTVSALGQDNQAPTLTREQVIQASRQPLVTMHEPPLGFIVAKQPLILEGELIGFQVQVLSEEAVDKVAVNVELRDLSEHPHRVAATKAYVNATVDELKSHGFTPQPLDSPPDVESHNFDTPFVIDIKLVDEAGITLLIRKRIFFTDKGYNMTIISSKEQGLEQLDDWAKSIKPANPQPDNEPQAQPDP